MDSVKRRRRCEIAKDDLVEKKRKDDLVDLQVHLTRLDIFSHKLPSAAEVEQAFKKCLRKFGPYVSGDADHVSRLEGAFTVAMDAIMKHNVSEYKDYLRGREEE